VRRAPCRAQHHLDLAVARRLQQVLAQMAFGCTATTSFT